MNLFYSTSVINIVNTICINNLPSNNAEFILNSISLIPLLCLHHSVSSVLLYIASRYPHTASSITPLLSQLLIITVTIQHHSEALSLPIAITTTYLYTLPPISIHYYLSLLYTLPIITLPPPSNTVTNQHHSEARGTP